MDRLLLAHLSFVWVNSVQTSELSEGCQAKRCCLCRSVGSDPLVEVMMMLTAPRRRSARLRMDALTVPWKCWNNLLASARRTLERREARAEEERDEVSSTTVVIEKE